MVIIFLLIGLVFGSFYNLLILKLPAERKGSQNFWSCFYCDAKFKGLDGLALVNFLLRRPQCKKCKENKNFRSITVEVMTAILFMLAYFKFDVTIELVKALFLISLCIMIAMIDFQHHIIPNKLNLLVALVGLLYWFIVQPFSLLNMLLGFIVGGSFMLLIALIGPMGGGDIKYMAAIGIWFGFRQTIQLMILAFIIGGIVSLLLLTFKVVDRKSTIAFGPYLCLASLLILFFEELVLV